METRMENKERRGQKTGEIIRDNMKIIIRRITKRNEAFKFILSFAQILIKTYYPIL